MKIVNLIKVCSIYVCSIWGNNLDKNKSKEKKPKRGLVYLQDPNTLETPKIMKPFYDADERLRQKLSPEGLRKEAKEFVSKTGKMMKKVKNR